MANFTAGTSFTDGVTNDVTALKLNALVADAVPTSSLALASTSGTISNFTSSTATLLGTITGSTNVINIGSGQIYKDASGNVGVGTASPSFNTGSGIEVARAGVSTLRLFNTSATTVGEIRADSVGFNIDGIGATSILRLSTGGGERLRITSGGVVRIGTTTELLSSANILETSGTNGIGIKATGGAGNSCMLAWNSAASGDNTFAIFYTEASPSSVGSIDFYRASTLTRYNTTSDATLKNIIGDSSGEESVSILKNTKIRDYTWKKDITNKVNVGVVAQELYEVFKGAVSVGGDIVSKDSEGNDITTYRPWGVDKTAFTFHLVAGWKAHEKLIQDLKTENDSLKSRIEALEAA
jgi:hypothetical protein